MADCSPRNPHHFVESFTAGIKFLAPIENCEHFFKKNFIKFAYVNIVLLHGILSASRDKYMFSQKFYLKLVLRRTYASLIYHYTNHKYCKTTIVRHFNLLIEKIIVHHNKGSHIKHYIYIYVYE